MTEGLVRTSTAPCLSCAAGGLRKKDKETMRRTTANNRTQVVMEPTFAKHPVLEGRGWGGFVMIMMYCVCEHALFAGPGVVNLTSVCICACVSNKGYTLM